MTGFVTTFRRCGCLPVWMGGGWSHARPSGTERGRWEPAGLFGRAMPRPMADDRQRQSGKREANGRAAGHASAASRGGSGRWDSASKIDRPAGLLATIRPLRHVRHAGHTRHGRQNRSGRRDRRCASCRPGGGRRGGRPANDCAALVVAAKGPISRDLPASGSGGATSPHAGSLPGRRRYNPCGADAPRKKLGRACSK